MWNIFKIENTLKILLLLMFAFKKWNGWTSVVLNMKVCITNIRLCVLVIPELQHWSKNAVTEDQTWSSRRQQSASPCASDEDYQNVVFSGQCLMMFCWSSSWVRPCWSRVLGTWSCCFSWAHQLEDCWWRNYVFIRILMKEGMFRVNLIECLGLVKNLCSCSW